MTTPKAPAAPRRTRSPNGVVSAKPVAVRLMPDELTLANKVAQAEQRTVASTVRLATLRGLAEYEKDPLAFTKLA